MPFDASEIPRNGSLSTILSFLTGRTIKIISIDNIPTGKLKAVAEDDTKFELHKLNCGSEHYFSLLDSASRKEALSRHIHKFLGCYAVLEIVKDKFEEYHSGTPIIVEEMSNGKSFQQILDNFSNEEKFDHDVKEELFGPLNIIAEFRNTIPDKYTPFVDAFSFKFMSLMTRIENDSNLSEVSEARRALGKWLPLIRKRPLSAVHGNLLPNNIIQKGKSNYKIFNQSDFLYGDVCIDIAGIIFGLIRSSYDVYGRMREPYITSASLIINGYADIKEIDKLLVPYVSYFAFKENLNQNKNNHFFNLARNILNEDEFDVNEINFLMELEFEVEKHEAES